MHPQDRIELNKRMRDRHMQIDEKMTSVIRSFETCVLVKLSELTQRRFPNTKAERMEIESIIGGWTDYHFRNQKYDEVPMFALAFDEENSSISMFAINEMALMIMKLAYSQQITVKWTN